MYSDSANTASEELRYIQAVNAALRWSLETRSDTVIFGEDVGIPGGPFGATKGLWKDFGPSRVFDTPISEQAFLGLALGAAMTGLRPIAEIMYVDFAFVAMDQIVNQIATARYASNGTYSAPLVVRTQQGYSTGSCAQHSHSAEAYFAHTPGIRIAVPSTPDDAYQMTRTAVNSDDPVLVLEARQLYPERGPVRLAAPVESMGGSRLVRAGGDAAIVTWGTMVRVAMEAAQELEKLGVNVDVIDLRWLSPLDLEPVREAASRHGRIVVAHEANLTGGFGAEISARLAEQCFSSLRAPVRRVATPDVHVPAAPVLQQALIPGVADLVAAVRSVTEEGRA